MCYTIATCFCTSNCTEMDTQLTCNCTIMYIIYYIICSHLQPIVNLLQFNQSGSTLETLHSDWRWKNRPWCLALSPSTGMACFYKSILSKVLLSLRWSCVHCVKLSIVLLLSTMFIFSVVREWSLKQSNGSSPTIAGTWTEMQLSRTAVCRSQKISGTRKSDVKI